MEGGNGERDLETSAGELGLTLLGRNKHKHKNKNKSNTEKGQAGLKNRGSCSSLPPGWK